MNKACHIALYFVVVLLSVLSCAKIDDVPSFDSGNNSNKQKMNFAATMDSGIPFGLVGIDYESGELVLDNAQVKSDGSGYSALFDSYLWSASNKITFSAYYPHVESVNYADNLENYSIPYSIPDDIEIGKQYTFHLGLDLSKIYKQISFSASVSDWETAIYENNDDF